MVFCRPVHPNEQPHVIYVFGPSSPLFEELYLSDLQSSYPYIHKENSDVVVLSQVPLDHIHIENFGAQNYVIETAFDSHPYCFYNGHLPSLSSSQAETLQSYLIATTPYLKMQMQGDLSLLVKNIPEYTLELCVKGSYGGEATADSKGNKEVKADATVQSDDGKKSGSIEVKGKQDSEGNKEASVTVSARKNF